MASQNNVDLVYYIQVSVPEGSDLGELMEEGVSDYTHEHLAPDGVGWVSRTLARFDYNEFKGGWLDEGLDLDYEEARAQMLLGEAGIATHFGRLALVFWYDAADRPFPSLEGVPLASSEAVATVEPPGARAYACGFLDDSDKFIEIWEGTKRECEAYQAGVDQNSDIPDFYMVRPR
jgi:hypothetical protein